MFEKKSEDSGIDKYLASISDFQETFSTPAGERVLRHLMHVTGFMRSTFVPNDPYRSAFNEGARDVVIQLVDKARIDLKRLEAELKRQPEGDTDVII